MVQQIVWLIDENKQQLTTYRNILRRLLPKSVQVKAIEPLPKKEDYILAVLENPLTACIIVDQKLKDTGIANYYGIELAKYLRGVNTKIPIYILTNYVNEQEQFVGAEWSVEDIISKRDMSDDEKLKILKARILRRINVYEDLLEEREHRFHDLLRKSLTDELSEEERFELQNLQFERTSVTLASELHQLDELERVVDKYKDIFKKFSED
jgi:CheY-like chemotaxis protein